MKAKVYVTLKPGVLDPQGKAIQHSVALLGFDGIADVRQGKYFEIALDAASDPERAREALSRRNRTWARPDRLSDRLFGTGSARARLQALDRDDPHAIPREAPLTSHSDGGGQWLVRERQ